MLALKKFLFANDLQCPKSIQNSHKGVLRALFLMMLCQSIRIEGFLKLKSSEVWLSVDQFSFALWKVGQGGTRWRGRRTPAMEVNLAGRTA